MFVLKSFPMIYLHFFFTLWLATASWLSPALVKKRKLVWREEFNATGQPNAQDWVYDQAVLFNFKFSRGRGLGRAERRR